MATAALVPTTPQRWEVADILRDHAQPPEAQQVPGTGRPGHRGLSHRPARRAPRGVSRLRLLARHLQLLPKPTLSEVPDPEAGAVGRGPAGPAPAHAPLPDRLHGPEPSCTASSVAHGRSAQPPLRGRLRDAARGRPSGSLKATIGFTAVLHTWNQRLDLHPHIHCLVPAGGLSLDGSRWIPTSKRFFLPIKKLRTVFRGKLLAKLEQALRAGRILGDLDRCPGLAQAHAQGVERLREGAARRTSPRRPLPLPIRPPDRHRELPHHRLRRPERHLPLQGPRGRQRDSSPHRQRSGLRQALPPARPAPALRPDPPLRHPRHPQTQGPRSLSGASRGQARGPEAEGPELGQGLRATLRREPASAAPSARPASSSAVPSCRRSGSDYVTRPSNPSPSTTEPRSASALVRLRSGIDPRWRSTGGGRSQPRVSRVQRRFRRAPPTVGGGASVGGSD